jgi:hypothetical protein
MRASPIVAWISARETLSRLWEVELEVFDGHLAREDERDRPREQPEDEGQSAADQ